MAKRTNLAVELWEEQTQSAEKTTQLPGVIARTTHRRGIELTTVKILDHRGEKAIGKPVGTYITLELKAKELTNPQYSRRCAEVISRALSGMMHLRQGMQVVAALGNRAVTPDAIGPVCADGLLITRHLMQMMPQSFGVCRPVAAVIPGVLGRTGIESIESVKSAVSKIKPDCVIVIDALAAGELQRLCSTVQISDAGIVPGSGVNNARKAFNESTLGVPVYAVGVPTVVSASTFLSGTAEKQMENVSDMILTANDIDLRIQKIGKILADSVNLALHDNLTYDEIAQLSQLM